MIYPTGAILVTKTASAATTRTKASAKLKQASTLRRSHWFWLSLNELPSLATMKKAQKVNIMGAKAVNSLCSKTMV